MVASAVATGTISEKVEGRQAEAELWGTLQVAVGGELVESSAGFVVFELSTPGTAGSTRVKAGIEAGVWRVRVAPEAALVPMQAQFNYRDGFYVAKPVPEPFAASASAPVVVHAELEYGVLLDVVAERTHERLQEAYLVLSRMSDGAFRELECPPDLFRDNVWKSESGAPPLPVPLTGGNLQAWVGGPGYAWRRVALRDAPGTMTVALADGADLLVRVPHPPSDSPHAVVRAFVIADSGIDSIEATSRSAPGALVAQRKLGTGTECLLDGLPAGRIMVALDANGRNPATCPRLAERTLELVPRQHGEIVLDPADPEAVASLGAVSYTLVLDAGPELLPARMQSVQLRKAESPEGAFVEYLAFGEAMPATHHGRFQGVPAGDYSLSVLPICASIPVRVEGAKEVDAVIEVKVPTTTHVSVVAAEDGRPLPDAGLAFRPGSTRGPDSWVEVKLDPSTGSYPMTVSPGTVTIAASLPGFTGRKLDLDVPADGGRLTISLERARSIPIVVRTQQAGQDYLTRLDFWAGVQVSSVEGTGQLLEIEMTDGQRGKLPCMDSPGAIYRVNGPGTYRLKFPGLPGVIPFDPIEVTVGPLGCEETVLEVEFR